MSVRFHFKFSSLLEEVRLLRKYWQHEQDIEIISSRANRFWNLPLGNPQPWAWCPTRGSRWWTRVLRRRLRSRQGPTEKHRVNMMFVVVELNTQFSPWNPQKHWRPSRKGNGSHPSGPNKGARPWPPCLRRGWPAGWMTPLSVACSSARWPWLGYLTHFHIIPIEL